MRKIIYKTQIKDRDEFERKLSSLDFDFGPMYWQNTRVFVPKNYKNHQNYPRMNLVIEMRAVNRPAKYELVCKRHIEDSGVTIVHSTQVRDYAEAANILLQLGFELQAEVPRRRADVRINEKTVVYLDRIDTLNEDFVKVEVELDDGESVQLVQQELESLLNNFGLREMNRVKETYAELA